MPQRKFLNLTTGANSFPSESNKYLHQVGFMQQPEDISTGRNLSFGIHRILSDSTTGVGDLSNRQLKKSFLKSMATQNETLKSSPIEEIKTPLRIWTCDNLAGTASVVLPVNPSHGENRSIQHFEPFEPATTFSHWKTITHSPSMTGWLKI